VVYAYQGIGAGIDTIFDDWCVYGNVVADNLIGQGKIRPVIIVAVNDQINGSPSADTINCVIPYMDANYATIPDADHRGVTVIPGRHVLRRCRECESEHVPPPQPVLPGVFQFRAGSGFVSERRGAGETGAEKPAAFVWNCGLGRLLPGQPGFTRILRFQ